MAIKSLGRDMYRAVRLACSIVRLGWQVQKKVYCLVVHPNESLEVELNVWILMLL